MGAKVILLRILLIFWKPVAAILGALGIYGKGMADQHAKAKLQAAEKAAQQHRDRDNVESDIRPATAADELRANWKR